MSDESAKQQWAQAFAHGHQHTGLTSYQGLGQSGLGSHQHYIDNQQNAMSAVSLQQLLQAQQQLCQPLAPTVAVGESLVKALIEELKELNLAIRSMEKALQAAKRQTDQLPSMPSNALQHVPGSGPYKPGSGYENNALRYSR